MLSAQPSTVVGSDYGMRYVGNREPIVGYMREIDAASNRAQIADVLAEAARGLVAGKLTNVDFSTISDYAKAACAAGLPTDPAEASPSPLRGEMFPEPAGSLSTAATPHSIGDAQRGFWQDRLGQPAAPRAPSRDAGTRLDTRATPDGINAANKAMWDRNREVQAANAYGNRWGTG